jgi:hypothetical protein
MLAFIWFVGLSNSLDLDAGWVVCSMHGRSCRLQDQFPRLEEGRGAPRLPRSGEGLRFWGMATLEGLEILGVWASPRASQGGFGETLTK